jgi:hypothetical protein
MMNWIDYSGINPGVSLPPDWTFRSADNILPADEISLLRGALLLTFCSEDVPADTIHFIRDHINLSGYNPLRGRNKDAFGVRFPDMSKPYLLPEGCKTTESIIIRAGENPDHKIDAPEATLIVHQAIIANHQGKRPFALLYGKNIVAENIIKLFQGEPHA